MTVIAAPPIDARTAADVARELDTRLAAAVPGWSDGTADHRAADHRAAGALLQAAARFAAIVLERVNRVPDRQRLAFLAAAGATPLPPQAATVPVTFALAPGTTVDVVVPAGTRVASADEPGRPSQLFETDRPLVASATRLDRLYVREPAEDRYADRRTLLSTAADPPVAPFRGDRPIEHSLAIGHRSLFGVRPVHSLSVTCGVAGDGDGAQRVVWEAWDGLAATPLTPASDSTNGLSRSGVVVFRDLGLLPAATVDGRAMRWLRARLAGPIVRPTLLNALTLQREVGDALVPLDAGTSNGIPLDLTKDFLPFGPQPRFGDTCHVASAAAFSLRHATVTLSVTLTQDGPDADGTIPPVNRDGRAHVLWEFWNGTAWVVLGRGRAGEDVRDESPTAFSDTTRALTHSGEVTFRFAEAPQPTTVAGVERYWIRARLAAGHYGQPPSPLAPPVAEAAAEKPRAAIVAPPMIRSIVATYRVVDTACAPDAVVACNDFEAEDVGDRLAAAERSVAVFRPTKDRRPALYFGFEPPAGRAFAGRPLSLYLGFGGATHAISQRPAATASPSVVCEYWRESHGWTRLSPDDGTAALTRSGTVVVLPPADCAPTREFGEVRYWLRVLWRGAWTDAVPPLRRVLANTTDATQASTRRDEILGSSRGVAGQVFRLARSPVLEGARIDVDEGRADPGIGSDGWIEWTIVADLLTSGPLDRHVVLDHAAGTVTFGDGRHGRIPPAGDGNVRAASYRTGGGAAGNVAARRIVQLKSPIPSIASVVNEEPAAGGGDGERVEAVIGRAPRAFRHGQRAVTIDDYQDLAVLASSEVARARCMPLCDLAADPEARRSRAGTVSVIVVPRGADDRPAPTLALLDRVHRYLAERQSPLVDLTVIGPEYVAVDVEASVRLRSLETVNDAEAAIRSLLSRFLHPVTGGRAGEGWDFGREPHRSDVFALIGRVGHVDHVEALRLSRRPDEAAVWRRRRFLVSAGTITLFFYA